MHFIRKHWIFLSLMLIGLFVRLIFMQFQGLSNDELSAWHRTSFDSWESFWVNGVKVGDMHPAFYQVLLWVWVRIFGDSEFALRSTSLLFYIGNSWLIYSICLRYFNQFSALLLQGLYVGLTFTIINTVFARPYNSGTFFILLAFLAVLQLRNVQLKKWKWTLILSIGFFGAMISHYFAFLVVLIIGLCGLFYIGKKNIKYLIIGGLVSIVAFIPHVPITLYQIGRGGLGWLAAPKLSWPLDFGVQFFNNSWFLLFLFLGILICCYFIFGIRKWTTEITFSISIFLSTFLVAFAVSHFFTPILRDLVTLFFLPFLLLPLFYLIKIQDGYKSYLLIGVVTFLPLFDSLFRNELLKPVHYGVFKEIGYEINKANNDFGKDSITFASNFNNVAYINYYVEKDLNESIIDWDEMETVYLLAERSKKSKTPYFCYSFSNKYTDPMFIEVIRQYYPSYERSLYTKFSSFHLFNRSERKEQPLLFFEGKSEKKENVMDEFFNEERINLVNLPKLKDKNDYYVLRSKGKLVDNVPFYLVVSVERNEQLLMKGDSPLAYFAFDQSRLFETGEDVEFYTAFQLPDGLLDSDQLKMYCWNPQKGKINISKMKLYVVSKNN